MELPEPSDQSVTTKAILFFFQNQTVKEYNQYEYLSQTLTKKN